MERQTPVVAAQRVVTKKRQVVEKGVFKAELNDFFQKHLCEFGYSGCDVLQLSNKQQIVVKATNTKDVVGPEGRHINELTALVCKRFGLNEDSIDIFADAVPVRGLCAIAQAENLKFKLIQGLAARRAAYGVLRQVMSSGAKGCEVVISGKLRAARAKSMKFSDGFMIHSGQPTKHYIVTAVRHVMLRQGVLGVKVKIMLDYDPEGKRGPNIPLPDTVVIHEPKDDDDEPITSPVVILAPKSALEIQREQQQQAMLLQQQQQQQQMQMQMAAAQSQGGVVPSQDARLMHPASTNSSTNEAAFEPQA